MRPSPFEKFCWFDDWFDGFVTKAWRLTALLLPGRLICHPSHNQVGREARGERAPSQRQEAETTSRKYRFSLQDAHPARAPGGHASSAAAARWLAERSGGRPRRVKGRAGHLRYFANFFNNENWFFAVFIKLIWRGSGLFK